jgi:hypothetical protein
MSRSELSAGYYCVMFDLEVAPSEEKTDWTAYIGSAQVFGKGRGEVQVAIAGFDQSDPAKLLA